MKKKLFLLVIVLAHFFSFGQNSADSNRVNSNNGILIPSSPNDSASLIQNEEICKNPDEITAFNGGEKALKKYLIKNTFFPLDVPDNVEGKVLVTFIVEKDGSVTNVKVIKSAHSSLSNEAIRVIKRMPKWIPGKKDGNLVRTKLIMPFAFSIHDSD
jgi:TonB family protein